MLNFFWKIKVLVLPLPQMGCVALGGTLNLSAPQFPHLHKGEGGIHATFLTELPQGGRKMVSKPNKSTKSYFF